ncbi:MAG: DUF1320 domain-containing protein [Candidatus Sumerlaeota bacterium]|nr:DUF1320 domain-containing protein [Candidatus Sumerlaeota bacterium]
MYSSLDDLVARLGADAVIALADDDGDSVVDETVITAAISDTDAEINARLAGRYVVPLESAPDAILYLSAILALERLYARRQTTPPDNFRLLAQEARQMLEALASGKANLPEGTPLSPAALSENTRRGQARTFDAEGMAEY